MSDKERQLHATAYELYQTGGRAAVEKFAASHGVKEKAFCNGCKNTEPVVAGACLICGSKV